MKIIKKIFSFALSIVICIVFIACIVSFSNGFILYKSVIEKEPLEDKISYIKNSDSYVKSEDISNDFLNAIYSVEDKRFYEHGAIDIPSIMRAIAINIKQQKYAEGGSTITQQLAKNLYFSRDKKLSRKIAEFFVARDFEKRYSKKEILEIYVNIIYYGDGFYGIKNASQGYFSKAPKNLTFNEATLLAGLPNAPSLLALSNNYDAAKKRQLEVLDALKNNGFDIKHVPAPK